MSSHFIVKEHSSVEIRNDVVVKTGDPASMYVEHAKSVMARSIGQSTGLFVCPEILEYDRERGRIIFQRMNLSSLSSMKNRGIGELRIAEQLGTALSAIHDMLELPNEMKHLLPAEFPRLNREVFLHGDISVDNVCVDLESGKLALIDWQMTSVYGGKATFGSRYFDLFWFAHNVINRPHLGLLRSDPVSKLLQNFLDAYFGTSKYSNSVDDMNSFARAFFEVVVPPLEYRIKTKSNGRARVLMFRSRALLEKFLMSLRMY